MGYSRVSSVVQNTNFSQDVTKKEGAESNYIEVSQVNSNQSFQLSRTREATPNLSNIAQSSQTGYITIQEANTANQSQGIAINQNDGMIANQNQASTKNQE